MAEIHAMAAFQFRVEIAPMVGVGAVFKSNGFITSFSKAAAAQGPFRLLSYAFASITIDSKL